MQTSSQDVELKDLDDDNSLGIPHNNTYHDEEQDSTYNLNIGKLQMEEKNIGKLNKDDMKEVEIDSKKNDEKTTLQSGVQKQENISFHWFTGVFIPMILNLLCVTYFMDLHRSIDHIGWGLGFFYFAFSITTSIGTLISICVIATNGEMKHGGCYYLISRTLGPEVGAVVGITLIISHASSISHKLHYVAATITTFYMGDYTGSERWDRTVWHFVMILVVLGLSMPHLKYVIMFLPLFAFLLGIGVLSILFGFFFRHSGDPSFFSGLSLKTLTENFLPVSLASLEYLQFLGALFPSANAVMTCANFSGNLRPVGRAIPIGGFTAMFLAAFIISGTFLLISGSFSFSQTNSNIDYSSIKASLFPIVTYIGFISACIGSAITMCVGGARIFAKMIEDHLLPPFFQKLIIRGEPIGCYCIIAFIAMIFAIIDNPTRATQLTNVFFSMPFALVNFAVWTAASANYPGFRPSFRFYNRWVALFLGILCIVRMFITNYIISLILIPLYIILWLIYHKVVKPQDTWGTVTQSRFFYTTLKEELNLYHYKPHPKTFRPNIIFISTHHPEEERCHIDLLNQILNGGGMAAIGRVLISSDPIDFSTLIEERDGTFLNGEAGYQTFYDITVAETFAEGVRDLLLLMGIGMMRPNTICLAFPEGWDDEDYSSGIDYEDFVNAIAMSFDANFSLTVLRNISIFSQEDKTSHIDVWWLIDDGGLTLLLPYLMTKQKLWKHSKLRLITIANTDDGNYYDHQQRKIETLLYKFRIRAEVIVIEMSFQNENPTPMAQTHWNKIADKFQFPSNSIQKHSTHRYLIVSDLVREYSSSSSFVFLSMMVPRANVDPRIFMAWLEVLSSTKVPFCFIRGNGENMLSWSV